MGAALAKGWNDQDGADGDLPLSARVIVPAQEPGEAAVIAFPPMVAVAPASGEAANELAPVIEVSAPLTPEKVPAKGIAARIAAVAASILIHGGFVLLMASYAVQSPGLQDDPSVDVELVTLDASPSSAEEQEAPPAPPAPPVQKVEERPEPIERIDPPAPVVIEAPPPEPVTQPPPQVAEVPPPPRVIEPQPVPELVLEPPPELALVLPAELVPPPQPAVMPPPVVTPPPPRQQARPQPAPPPEPVRTRREPPRETPRVAETPPRASPSRPVPAIGADQRGSNARTSTPPANYIGMVQARLMAAKSYPPAARARGETGSARVRFSIQRSGSATAIAVVASTGHAALDEAAAAMVRRAAPFPPLPTEFSGAVMVLTVPVSFTLR